MPAFSASAIVLKVICGTKVRRQNILGLIVQLEVLPKLMHSCSFLSEKLNGL